MGITALIIGGSGVVGREVVKLLCDADHVDHVVHTGRRAAHFNHPKLQSEIVDFSRVGDFSEVFKGDCLFSCLGTTRKQAGSVIAQRLVDFDFQYECAKLAKTNGIKHHLLVSSSGADRHSRLAYPRMKGELEFAINALEFPLQTVLQPSLLLGEREDRRLGEEIAAKILPTVTKFPFLSSYRPITGHQVAQRLVKESLRKEPARMVLTLDQIFIG